MPEAAHNRLALEKGSKHHSTLQRACGSAFQRSVKPSSSLAASRNARLSVVRVPPVVNRLGGRRQAQSSLAVRYRPKVDSSASSSTPAMSGLTMLARPNTLLQSRRGRLRWAKKLLLRLRRSAQTVPLASNHQRSSFGGFWLKFRAWRILLCS